jgi:undecaprenyl-diphosphatase
MNREYRRLAPNRTLLVILIIALAFYVLLPQIGSFKDSLSALRHADMGYLIIGGVCALATYMAAAATYCLLSLHSVCYFRMLSVQLASAFANRLLPAGIGGIGVNYRFLRHQKHAPTQAASVVTANNTIGFIGHSLILTGTLLLTHDKTPGLHLWRARTLLVLVAAMIALVVVFVLLSRRLQKRILRSLSGLLRQLADYRHRGAHVSAALLTSIVLTFSYVLGLWACSYDLGTLFSFVTVLLIFTLSVAVGTVTPTPGGLGGVEAGLVAGFVAYGTSSSTALAIVLAYRGLTYWLPLLIGIPAFIATERLGYYRISSR